MNQFYHLTLRQNHLYNFDEAPLGRLGVRVWM